MPHCFNILRPLLVGIIAVPSGGGGTFFGGWIIKRLSLHRTRILLMCSISQFITIFPLIAAFLLECNSQPYVGVNHFKAEIQTLRNTDILYISLVTNYRTTTCLFSLH